MTAKQVQHALASHYRLALFNPLRNDVAPNCLVAGWECDLIVIRPSGWALEVEIKVSVSDFRRDMGKTDKHLTLKSGAHHFKGHPSYRGIDNNQIVRHFYYAVPSEIQEKVQAELPAHAGLIVVAENTNKHSRAWAPNLARVVVKAPTLPARKVTGKERDTLLKSVYHRHWKYLSEAVY